jgi:hypothetical protein
VGHTVQDGGLATGFGSELLEGDLHFGAVGFICCQVSVTPRPLAVPSGSLCCVG